MRNLIWKISKFQNFATFSANLNISTNFRWNLGRFYSEFIKIHKNQIQVMNTWKKKLSKNLKNWQIFIEKNISKKHKLEKLRCCPISLLFWKIFHENLSSSNLNLYLFCLFLIFIIDQFKTDVFMSQKCQKSSSVPKILNVWIFISES